MPHPLPRRSGADECDNRPSHFAASGAAKLTMARERLIATGQTGVAMFPMPVVRFTAAMELLAAVGLVAPGLTGIGTVLTPLAALGLCVVMIGAAWAHSRLHEPRSVLINAVMFGLAAFVIVGRLL
ncbi:DoxX family protein [Mycolicibacter senuensis]|uniref:DoxX family protein n=1 Tax=Mycolicibacter senuensis TaxID=386913 RepID=UPI000DCEE5E1|nr:DoxX family protein [Mycolicibacter senuensis]